MRFLYVLRYFFNEAFLNLWTNRFNNLISVSIISFSLFTFGLFLLTAENLNRLIGSWTEKVQINVFLDKQPAVEKVLDVEALIKNAPCVADYKYITEDEALKRFRSYYPSMKELADNLESNPFPPSYEITIREEFQSKNAVLEFVTQLRGEDVVDDVEYDQEWIERMQFIIHFVRVVGLFFGGILMFTATFSISNVIKLMVMSRKDEIEIMRLVGATNSFIKGPFLAEGILQGLLAGTFAVGTLYLMFLAIRGRVAAMDATFFQMSQLSFLADWVIFVASFLGTLISIPIILKKGQDYALPFGTFIGFAALPIIFWGDLLWFALVSSRF